MRQELTMGHTLPEVRVRPASGLGWRWNVGHECDYICGAGGCSGAGWRPTRMWAVRAGLAYRRGLARYYRRSEREWETVSPEQPV